MRTFVLLAILSLCLGGCSSLLPWGSDGESDESFAEAVAADSFPEG